MCALFLSGEEEYMITSSSNAQIKKVQQILKKAKTRREEGLFAVEGVKMFREAPAERIEKVYVSESFSAKEECGEVLAEKGLDGPGGQKVEIVEDRVFKSLSDTVTPQGVLCLIRMQNRRLEGLLAGDAAGGGSCAVLEDLQDPGNLGTIIRTGEGAGVTGVILSRTSVDVYNPKVIRSTMGSIYRMPVLYVDSIAEEVLPLLKEREIRTYAAHLKGKHTYDRENYEKGTAFFIGNEGNGLTDELTAQADTLIRIPMEGSVESLNAAMASGILMYEASRQRRNIN